MASSSINLPTIQCSLLRNHFLGQTHIFNGHKPQSLTLPKQPFHLNPCAKFDLFQIMGGRGLCNGEQGIQNELKRNLDQEASSTMASLQNEIDSEKNTDSKTETTKEEAESGFEKELMGLTGGFPGGEKGLKKFVELNPPPVKTSETKSRNGTEISISKKSKPPELPLLMPGMIALVSNANSPYYLYCGIVQRITDGKAGVLFEGGNWDRLITFRLEELERREKGPPTKSPRSVMIEPFLNLDSKS